MALQSPFITVMLKASRKAGRALIRNFNEVGQLQVSVKGPRDFVTAADLKAEQEILSELRYARPDFGFLLEAEGAVEGKDKDHRWIVNPLDGVVNYMHAVPHFAISIAVERRGEIIASTIYDPVKDEFFWAEKGQGAYQDSRRLRVSARRKMSDGLFSTNAPAINRPGLDLHLAEAAMIMPQAAGVRHTGSVALDLAYVAAGRAEGHWEHGLRAWDLAAGMLMVKEAGGMVTDFASTSTMLTSGEIIAANADIHTPLLRSLRKADKQAKAAAASAS